jgi:hypothetical protein
MKMIITFTIAFLLFNGALYVAIKYIMYPVKVTLPPESTTTTTTATTTTMESTTKKSFSKILFYEMIK